MANTPEFDVTGTLLFVINAGAGHHDPDATQRLIERTLRAKGRAGELLNAAPGELANVARKGAALARARGTAVIAVGGDGTINTVAQAAYAENCAMGVVPQGTFNYFARTHGIPADAASAVQAMLESTPRPVQVGLINDQVFLVNASVGLYPELLQDREAYKARFGRSRLVAFGAALVTLLTRHRQLQLHIELSTGMSEVRTPTLFVGNNRLQLEQVGLPEAHALDEGSIAAVMLRPIGSLAMLGLLFRGALGSLGESDTVESFKFRRMIVTPRNARLGRQVKVAFDGELSRMRAPLEFRVAPRPLFLLKSGVSPTPEQGAA